MAENIVRRFLEKVRDVGASASTGFRIGPSDVGSIRRGINDSKVVNFVYTRRDGKTLFYNGVEPYEIKDGYFWGWHKKHNSIHKFVLSRMRDVKETQTDFEPRNFENT